jgi:pyrroline-5-carboxylate reductase
MKPQQLPQVAAELAPRWRDDLTLISVLAGVTVAGLRSAITLAGDIVRVMPNTPVAVGQGVCALYADSITSDAGKASSAALMQPLGLVEWINDEAQFNLVTAISGCGPAFLFRFIDALGAAAAQLGMDQDQAQRLALATVQGAANLAAASTVNPAQLADNVASPGGMTREGLNVLDADRRLENLLLDTLRAARDRGEYLAEKATKA